MCCVCRPCSQLFNASSKVVQTEPASLGPGFYAFVALVLGGGAYVSTTYDVGMEDVVGFYTGEKITPEMKAARREAEAKRQAELAELMAKRQAAIEAGEEVPDLPMEASSLAAPALADVDPMTLQVRARPSSDVGITVLPLWLGVHDLLPFPLWWQLSGDVVGAPQAGAASVGVLIVAAGIVSAVRKVQKTLGKALPVATLAAITAVLGYYVLFVEN